VFFNDVGKLFNIDIGINLRPDRVWLAVLIVLFAIDRHRVRVRVHAVEWLLMVLLLWGFASLVIAGTIYHPHNRHLATLVNLAGIPLLVFWIARRANLSHRDVGVILRILIGLGFYLGLTAAAEHYQLSALVFPSYILDESIGIHVGRARGPFGNAAVMGGVLSVIYLITLFYITNIRASIPMLLLMALMAVGVYFTYTRSAWLTFIVSVTSLGLFRGKLRTHAAIVGTLVLLVFMSGVFSKLSFGEGTLFTKRQGPVEDRENLMRASIAMIKDRPLFGFGYGTFETANDHYFDRVGKRSDGEGNHNAFAGLVVELGLIGSWPYIMVWWFLFRIGWRLAWLKNHGNEFWVQFGTLTTAVLAGYVINIQFFDPRFFGFMNCLIFLLFGLASAAQERYGRDAPN
jgi:O-antigen ligase